MNVDTDNSSMSLAIDAATGDAGHTRREFVRRVGAGSLALSVAGLTSELFTVVGAKAGSLESTALLNELTISFSGSAPTLDIASSFVGNISSLMLIIHEPLVTYDSTLKVAPHLAQSWTQPRSNEYRFKLRPGVKFWDGSALTVDDVVYSFARILDPKFGSTLKGTLDNLKAVKAVDRTTVSFELKTADQTFPYLLTLVGVVKRALAEPLGRKYAAPGSTFLGTGPFKVVRYESPQAVQLERFSGYWGKKPEIAKMSVSTIPDEVTRQLAMRSGQTIMSFDVHPDQGGWKDIPNVAVPVAAIHLETAFMAFDLSQPPFGGDPHLRRAFRHAWNPQFVKTVLGTVSQPATAVIPPGLWSNVLTAPQIKALYAKVEKYPFDLGRARSELRQSRVPDGLTVRLVVPNVFADLQKAALNLQENLKQIGVRLDVDVQPRIAWEAYKNAHKNLIFQVTKHGPTYFDPQAFLQTFFQSNQAIPYGRNLANYHSWRFDKIFDQQRGTKDPKKRAALLSQLMIMSANSNAYLPLYWSGFAIAYRKDRMRYNKPVQPIIYLQRWPEFISAA